MWYLPVHCLAPEAGVCFHNPLFAVKLLGTYNASNMRRLAYLYSVSIRQHCDYHDWNQNPRTNIRRVVYCVTSGLSKVYTRGTLPRQKSRIYCSKPANVFKASRDALDGDKAAINLQNDRAIDSNINVKKKKKKTVAQRYVIC